MFAGSAFAYGYPRWFTMPISVYIPKQEEGVVVAGAFKSWQTGTKSCVRFLLRNSKNLASISNINVVFVDAPINDKLYFVRHRFSQFGGCRSCGNRFYNNSDIIISLKDKDGKDLSTSQLRAVAIQAVGRAVGLNLNEDKNSVMYEETDFSNSSITPDAVQSVYNLYKPSRR